MIVIEIPSHPNYQLRYDRIIVGSQRNNHNDNNQWRVWSKISKKYLADRATITIDKKCYSQRRLIALLVNPYVGDPEYLEAKYLPRASTKDPLGTPYLSPTTKKLKSYF